MLSVLVVCPIPFTGVMSRGTKASMDAVKNYRDDEITIRSTVVRGSHVPRARNVAVKLAINNGYDYLLNVDGDITFTVSDIKALATTGLESVGGAYVARDNKDVYCAGMWGETIGVSPSEKRVSVNSNGVHAVDWLGSGFHALNVKKLREKVPVNVPWFRYYFVTLPDGSGDFTTEDFGICAWLKECGVQTNLCCDVVVQHKPFILPECAPDIDLRDWVLKLSSLTREIDDMGIKLCEITVRSQNLFGGVNRLSEEE